MRRWQEEEISDTEKLMEYDNKWVWMTLIAQQGNDRRTTLLERQRV